jgi:hypothetical protein
MIISLQGFVELQICHSPVSNEKSKKNVKYVSKNIKNLTSLQGFIELNIYHSPVSIETSERASDHRISLWQNYFELIPITDYFVEKSFLKHLTTSQAILSFPNNPEFPPHRPWSS